MTVSGARNTNYRPEFGFEYYKKLIFNRITWLLETTGTKLLINLKGFYINK